MDEFPFINMIQLPQDFRFLDELCRAEFIMGNMKIFQRFLYILNLEMALVIDIHPH